MLGGQVKLRWRNRQLIQENKRLHSLVNQLGAKMLSLELNVSSLKGELAGMRFALLALKNGARENEGGTTHLATGIKAPRKAGG